MTNDSINRLQLRSSSLHGSISKNWTMCDISIPLVRPLLLPTIVIAAYGRDGPKYSCSARLIRPIAIVKNARVFFTLRTKETINAVSRLSLSLNSNWIFRAPVSSLILAIKSSRFDSSIEPCTYITGCFNFTSRDISLSSLFPVLRYIGIRYCLILMFLECISSFLFWFIEEK